MTVCLEDGDGVDGILLLAVDDLLDALDGIDSHSAEHVIFSTENLAVQGGLRLKRAQHATYFGSTHQNLIADVVDGNQVLLNKVDAFLQRDSVAGHDQSRVDGETDQVIGFL